MEGYPPANAIIGLRINLINIEFRQGGHEHLDLPGFGSVWGSGVCDRAISWPTVSNPEKCAALGHGPVRVLTRIVFGRDGRHVTDTDASRIHTL